MFDADQDYAEACNPGKWKILGLPLADYCEGHKLLLKRAGSPLVCGGAVDGSALVFALLICARSYEDGQVFSARGLSLKHKLLTCLVGLADCIIPRFVYNRAEAIAQYIQEAERLPKGIFRRQMRPDGKPQEVTHAPSALVFESDLCNHYGCSLSEVMNMPMRKATFLRYRLLELDEIIRWRAPWMGDPPKKEAEAANG